MKASLSNTIPIILISSLIAIGLLGMWGINMTDSNGRHSCPVSLLSSDECLPASGLLAEVFHHISGLQNFAQGAINTNTSLLMILLLLVLVFYALPTFLRKTPVLETSSYLGHREIEESGFLQKKRFLRWIALRHKRDPHALPWVHDYS